MTSTRILTHHRLCIVLTQAGSETLQHIRMPSHNLDVDLPVIFGSVDHLPNLKPSRPPAFSVLLAISREVGEERLEEVCMVFGEYVNCVWGVREREKDLDRIRLFLYSEL